MLPCWSSAVTPKSEQLDLGGASKVGLKKSGALGNAFVVGKVEIPRQLLWKNWTCGPQNTTCCPAGPVQLPQNGNNWTLGGHQKSDLRRVGHWEMLLWWVKFEIPRQLLWRNWTCGPKNTTCWPAGPVQLAKIGTTGPWGDIKSRT